MALEEKRAWIMAVVSACGYAVYLVIVLGRMGDTPIAEVSYVSPLLWTVGVAIAVSIVLGIATDITTPKDDKGKDARDREIERFGDHVGQSFIVIGGIAALVMSMAETGYFWIANAIYLAFALSGILGSVARIFAYRRGFQSW